MLEVVALSDSRCVDVRSVGGKGAQLGRLVAEGLPVPPGFVVTTEAYTESVRSAGLHEAILDRLTRVNYDEPGELERVSAEIRDQVAGIELPPELVAVVGDAYRHLDERFVAVRSSGTAEDLEGTSFAGLHDTFLDVVGSEAVLRSIVRCWASLWTARAVHYRHSHGFDHSEVSIAVVVQAMVPAETAGVMFTGHPITAVTDEIVVNANWGLGESVVQGITNPDEFVVKSATLQVKTRTAGSKELKIVQDEGSSGTVTVPVDPADRGRLTLTDHQLVELAALGRRVQTVYEEMPQDIEWAYAGGTFHLLQARPITGVEFSWDEDVNDCIAEPDSDEYHWTRAWADMAWTGAITPLMFSWRGPSWVRGQTKALRLWGHDDIASLRLWKFHRSEVYYNCEIDKRIVESTVPPVMRPMMLANIPTTWHQEILDAPFSYMHYLRIYARLQLLEREQGLYKWFDVLEKDYHRDRAEEYNGLPREELPRLSDRELMRYVQQQIELEHRYNESLWSGYILYYRDMLALFSLIVSTWYDGDNKGALMDLLTGTRTRTATAVESVTLWQLAARIRNSAVLQEAFEQNRDGAFFAELENTLDGQEFLTAYRDFLTVAGHRGHEDRDIYFPRRSDDPSIDYRALRTILSSGAVTDPVREERRVNERREAVADEVRQNISRKPLGGLKATAFTTVFDWVHRFLVLRDEERNFIDRSSHSIRLGCIEVGRRLLDRGQIDTDRDFWFLSVDELFTLFRAQANPTLTRAKIASRMRNFDRFDGKEIRPPKYLHDNRPVDLDSVPDTADDGSMRGVGTSPGTVTGTARVVPHLKDIDRIKAGDILVTHSTDPGWTPVFLVIKGIVLETGGLFAHGSLLAREYGFPAVQVDESTDRIPDGATISIDGSTGVVRIVDAPVPV